MQRKVLGSAHGNLWQGGNGTELHQEVQVGIGKLFFIVWMVKHWNKLPEITESNRDWNRPLEIVWSNLLLKQIPYNRSHRTTSREVFAITRGGTTTSLGSLFQYSVTLKI